MSVGKYISLEEALRKPRLLPRFIRERIAAGHGQGDRERFDATLESMVRNSPPDAETSSGANGEDCTETQIRGSSSRGTSGRRGRASRE